MKQKQILLAQNQSSSLRLFLKYFSGRDFVIKIAPNLSAILDVNPLDAPDFVVISASILKPKSFSTLAHLQIVFPKSKIVLTHAVEPTLRQQVAEKLPQITIVDMPLDDVLPHAITDLFKPEKANTVLRSVLQFVPKNLVGDRFADSWFAAS